MAITTRNQRQVITNIFSHCGLSTNPSVGINVNQRANTSFQYYFFSGIQATGYFFDVRVMNRAISQSDGQATNPDNLGTVHYTYDDMRKNDGKVTLPFG